MCAEEMHNEGRDKKETGERSGRPAEDDWSDGLSDAAKDRGPSQKADDSSDDWSKGLPGAAESVASPDSPDTDDEASESAEGGDADKAAPEAAEAVAKRTALPSVQAPAETAEAEPEPEQAPPPERAADDKEHTGRARTWISLAALALALMGLWYVAWYRRSASFYGGLLDSPEVSERMAASQKLRDMGPEAAPALADLVRALNDPVHPVRLFVSEAITQIEPGRHAETVALLLKALGETGGQGRAVAISLLGDMGAAEAVPAILGRLKDPDEHVRRAGIRALARLAPDRPEVVAALFGMLKDRNSQVSAEAGKALAEIGKKDKTALARLIAVAQKGGTREARAAIATVSLFGPAAKSVAPDLAALAKRPATRAAAINALRRVAPQSPVMVRLYLEDARTGKTKRARVSAAQTLARLAIESPVALAMVKQTLPSLPDGARAEIEKLLRRANKL